MPQLARKVALPVCLLLPLLPAHAAATRTTDGEKPRVAIVLPHTYRQEDFPLGTKHFQLDTNVRMEDIERTWWSLDGVRSEHEGVSAEFTFQTASAHVVEACVMTNRVNHCARQRLGPPDETVQTRLRPITVWVSKLGRPDEPVTGLGADDFSLTYHHENLDDRIESVSENSARDRVGICLAYLFDMSGSMIHAEGQSGLLVVREDGSYSLAPALKARFDAFVEVMKGTSEPGVARPDKDMIIGAVFALGLISIGPIPASEAETLPGRIEKALVREYQTSPSQALWWGTALRENVAMTATLLNQAASCRDRKKAIAVDSDLLQSSFGAKVDLNDRTLESVRKDYAEYDSDRLVSILIRKEALTVPIYAFVPHRAQEPGENVLRDSFLQEVVEPSGGESYYTTSGSPAEAKARLQTLFGHLLRHIAASYDLFWDPEGIEDPDEVIVRTKTAETLVTIHMPTAPRSDTTFARKVLLDRAGRFDQAWSTQYDRRKKMAAAMFIRKRIEEGKGSPASRNVIRKALAKERDLQPPSVPLVEELELALCAIAEEDIKYDADAGTILEAARDLEQVETVAQERLLAIAASVPPEIRSRLCKSAPPQGREGNAVRSSLCAEDERAGGDAQ